MTAYMATDGRTYLKVVLTLLDDGRTTLRVRGNLMSAAWNCFVLSRLHISSGTVAVCRRGGGVAPGRRLRPRAPKIVAARVHAP